MSSKSTPTNTPLKSAMKPTKPAESNDCPFCCTGAIPSTFKHLFCLLAPGTMHHPLDIPMFGTSFLASFLSSAIYTNLAPTSPNPFPYYAIIEVLQLPLDTFNSSAITSKRYFVPVPRGTDNGLGPGQLVKGWIYMEIEKAVADESLRPEESGIAIGDWEIWSQMPDVERLLCLEHACGFELRAWVRLS